MRKAVGKKGWPFVDEEDKKGEDKKKTDGQGHGYACGQNDDLDDAEPWNAVCVVGLRVYAKDPAVTIELVKAEKETATKGKRKDQGRGSGVRMTANDV